MTASTIDLTAALTRLRGAFGETATAELLAAAWTAAETWPAYPGGRPDNTHRHKLAVALEAHASAAWIRARTERDAYLRPQVRAGSLNVQSPMDDLLTLVGAGAPALEAMLDRAVADLERLRDALRDAPARPERTSSRPRGRALN
ncbi:MAG TPA: hypothetical protein VL086_09160 [Candidatus Nitrosotalea sp.]|nr:hypothetical protein [Candidatus Nitrosotalea sp.]